MLTLVRSLLTAAGMVSAYYLLPMDQPFTARTLLALIAGLLAVTGLLAWQIRMITRSPHPRLQAVETLATTLPLFLLLFSATYYLMARDTPTSFSEPLSRTGSLYFTVTVFSTVGFGDIVPQTETARLLAIGQIVADLLVLGVVARLLVGAVQEGVQQHQPLTDPPEGGPPTG
ncbi:potassium channel family protein [Streptomyces sp. NRRL WC-3742]|uniref:potassium channel family protein n=1 Tax=Streptomyces sp. NRRL WC-3742 TaxID=1463934 RepID=UPI000B292EDB|nr:potassium channel family protein [Streptomyces sp. NRRL WC-3742]